MGKHDKLVGSQMGESRRMYSIKVYKNSNSYTWELLSKNHKIIGSSEYTRKEMCLKTANKLGKDLNCEVKFIDLMEDYEE